MSTIGSLSPVRRSRLYSVAAVVGVVLAVAWFVSARLMRQRAEEAEKVASVSKGVQLVALLRQTAQDRVKTGAQVLAQDTRLQAVSAMAKMDRPTVNDLLQDLQKLDPRELFALLSSRGEVIAALGAPQLNGLNLASSEVVKAALAGEGTPTGVWVVDDRVVEIAASPVRAGERLVGVLVVGIKLEDSALATVADAAGVHVGLLLEGRPVWSSAPVPESTWRGPQVSQLEVSDAARYAIAPTNGDPSSVDILAWAVPVGALLFATLGFWRGGGP